MLTAVDPQALFPIGPHAFEAEIDIDRPASDVYPLLDLADPRHAKRQLGDRVEERTDAPGRFAMVVAQLPDVVFALTVTHEVSGREYGFACEASQRFGRVAQSHEHYALHERGEGGCRVVLTQTVIFDAPLPEQDFAREAMMLTMANASALAKLKLHAEDGVEAVRCLG